MVFIVPLLVKSNVKSIESMCKSQPKSVIRSETSGVVFYCRKRPGDHKVNFCIRTLNRRYYFRSPIS